MDTLAAGDAHVGERDPVGDELVGHDGDAVRDVQLDLVRHHLAKRGPPSMGLSAATDMPRVNSQVASLWLRMAS